MRQMVRTKHNSWTDIDAMGESASFQYPENSVGWYVQFTAVLLLIRHSVVCVTINLKAAQCLRCASRCLLLDAMGKHIQVVSGHQTPDTQIDTFVLGILLLRGGGGSIINARDVCAVRASFRFFLG